MEWSLPTLTTELGDPANLLSSNGPNVFVLHLCGSTEFEDQIAPGLGGPLPHPRVALNPSRRCTYLRPLNNLHDF
jgi:hypothetical protein